MSDNKNKDFIREIIDKDLESGRFDRVHTRFPPEPNGYLHIGHAKAICLNFGIAKDYNGKCNLRMDDTNPTKESMEYVEAIKRDVKWLGFDWEDRLYFASDNYDKLYELAVQLIKMGKAYVCDLSPDEIREYRGTLTEPGKNSPYRDRSIEENLELFEKMKNGEFKDGEKVLRAKIDMSSPNLNMRDPVIYRILRYDHYRTGNKWCIYPMYDWTHGFCDSWEGITHSICTLEFEDHRPLYDWFLDVFNMHHPRQIEFARLNLTYTVMSKRKLLQLVKEGYVNGWDDPRMPTICGLRRRGFTPESIRDFCARIGVSKVNSTIDYAFLEHCLREDLNKRAQRVMVVLNPLKVIIDNYPDDLVEYVDAENNPEDSSAGFRKLPFSKVIYIEKDDFMIDPPKKYFRLSPGKEIRLKYAYYIKCVDYKLDENGEVVELHCTYDPETKGGWSQDGRIVKGTAHWVSASHGVKVEVRLYDKLFTKENPEEVEEGKTFLDYINKDSLKIIKDAIAEPSLAECKPYDLFQFLRVGYFVADPDYTKEHPVFNKSVSLKDSWSKIAQKEIEK
ncbi:MAG TPA: glutamine--tRNA ligase/YqeY domain fusion protein [Spirochaetota bacterium]|nr:glutamine--tRNA ligase/YqeY domain fusion protein [Spirochaetota bacterium]HOL56249.1 glutamine--tRNA ligase/YqeY domain fusion protein [Spirochaetota bacterium]HPP05126.1 glutamine--tRNA ligase/YqeY domain fusion protein [Spirochaetota bacterium]